MTLPAATPAARTAFATPAAGFRSPGLPNGVRFALWPRLESGVKPFAFATLDALARHIHRRRDEAAIQLNDVTATFTDADRRTVRIDTLGPGGEADTLIGFAYLGGAGFEVLSPALLRAAGIGVAA